MIKAITFLFATAGILVLFQSTVRTAELSNVAWVGRGSYRVLIKVHAMKTNRATDQMPAEVALDFRRDVAPQLGLRGRIDVASIQVIRYQVESGQPISFGGYAYGTSEWDCPFRWYDGAIPYEFPDYHRSVAPTDGEIKDWRHVARWGHLFGTMGDWDGGRLAWVHTQIGNQPSYYAIYFDVLPQGKQPEKIPPAGFLGDAMDRRAPVGDSTTGLLDSRVAIDDWNEDGLFDLVVGSARGVVVYYPNVGTKKQPRFVYSKLLFTADGKPLDVGISSEPFVVDWDGDEVKDLLIGANGNRLLFFKNTGSNKQRIFVNKGFVQVAGKPLSLPFTPVPGGRGVFDDDYHPVPEVVDWDKDGDLDLLLGGYVTGSIFLFENTGRAADGTPVLQSRGGLQADGQLLDVEWCAAPTVADFDGDGDLDLITGTLRYTDEGIDPTDNEVFMRYFENMGTRTTPVLRRKPFPRSGNFPSGPLVTPRAYDFNADGLLDLVVSSLDDIYLFPNVGTKEEPRFDVSSKFLPSEWGNDFIAHIGSQLVDWSRDGHFDIVTQFSVRLNKNKGWPNIFGESHSLLQPGVKIAHPAPMGDNYSFTRVADLDGDGALDILFGDHGGHVYFHKNLGGGSTNLPTQFETAGKKVMLSTGAPLKVGPAEGAGMSFQVLQGARTTFDAGDFNRDGKQDLVVGDTYGKVRYFENRSGPNELVFAEGILIGDMGNRMAPCAADWNQDGFPDVIGVASSGAMELYLNRGEKDRTTFAPGTKFEVPPVAYWPAVRIIDWNGDGDLDLMIPTNYLYFVWVERSYLEHGYAKGELLTIQKGK